MSFIDNLCKRITDNPKFLAEFDAIERESILNGSGLGGGIPIEDAALQRLMQSAAIFAQSGNLEWRQLAYRISIGSLTYQEKFGGVSNVAQLTLARLGNYPAIRFAFSSEQKTQYLVPTLFFEIQGRQDENTVRVGDRATTLTDMQQTVWRAVVSGKSLALSAPTSAGKSFVFLAYIESVKRSNPGNNIVYLVPSRALISQVSTDLRAGGIDRSYGVVSVPIKSSRGEVGTPIYVLTPERLQVLLQSEPDFKFDIAIVDEAHLIGDGSRGVVLHAVLQELYDRNSNSQFLFSSPQVRDPSIFGTIVGNSDIDVVKTKDSPVAQNIIFLKGDSLDTRKLTVTLWRTGKEIELTEIYSSLPVYNSEDRLIYSSWVLGAGSQSLVYADGPATCENIAIKLKNLATDESVSSSIPTLSEDTINVRKELSKFAKESVHQSYVLSETVEHGIGFHYGRIPTLLRSAIEEAFSNGYLDYIVCTSTLLQGVNMPARNVFMYNPHKGSDKPIEPVDFWNLAGRAGRLGKDFQGNVFLVDYDQWKSAPLAGPKDEPVKPSLEMAIVSNFSEFREYIERNDVPSGENPLFESAFGKLLRDHRRGQLRKTLDRVPALSSDLKNELEQAISEADSSIKLETDTLGQSPQISGFRQQQLYDYMVSKIEEKGPDYLIPVHPSASWQDAINKLRPVFGRVHKYLELKSGNHHRYWAPLALRWMRGEPLPRIIDDAIKYHKGQGKRRDNRTIIREVLIDVESGLRFRYVNLIGCYTSVLKQALNDKGFASHVSKIPALTLYLELGAASTTMIQLMSLGLSRHTAHLVSSFTINRDMDLPAARSYLRGLNPQSLGLSPFLISEIRRVSSGT